MQSCGWGDVAEDWEGGVHHEAGRQSSRETYVIMAENAFWQKLAHCALFYVCFLLLKF
jgi:hypothetical protein